MRKLLDEIKSGQHFEELVSAYFKFIKEANTNNIIDISVVRSGKGSDGGIDILLTFELNDGIRKFQRKWVVQCKFHERNVGKSLLSDVNIPTLIHEYGAVGYLLVVKTDVVNELQKSFENLNKSCKFGYRYEIWKGDEFTEKLMVTGAEKLQKQYFSEYLKTTIR